MVYALGIFESIRCCLCLFIMMNRERNINTDRRERKRKKESGTARVIYNDKII